MVFSGTVLISTSSFPSKIFNKRLCISCISVTLAWFAYSGIAKVATEIEVKSWLIEFEKNETTVSNNIVISLAEIYPGMDTLYETIKIKNRGNEKWK